jgi:hypothetical protein
MSKIVNRELKSKLNILFEKIYSYEYSIWLVSISLFVAGFLTLLGSFTSLDYFVKPNERQILNLIIAGDSVIKVIILFGVGFWIFTTQTFCWATKYVWIYLFVFHLINAVILIPNSVCFVMSGFWTVFMLVIVVNEIYNSKI